MTIVPPSFPRAWLQTAELKLDACRAVFDTENYPVACELAWGVAENAVKAAICKKAVGRNPSESEYKTHRISALYNRVTESDSLGISGEVQNFSDYNEYVRYPKLKEKDKIEMPADKYTEARAEKALVSAGLILDAARAYVA